MAKDEKISQTAPPSFHSVHEKRYVQMLRTVFDFSFGTLWWIGESLWKETLRGRYDQHSTRNAHPGLMLLRVPVEDRYSMVPILHGSSYGRGVKVRGLDLETPDRITSFGPLLAPIAAGEALPWPKAARIHPNKNKPRIDSSEVDALERFLCERGLEQ
jgi:hypothetical protein